MVRTVLWYFLWALVAAIILIWLVAGGFSKIEAATKSFPSDPFTSLLFGDGAITLPWAVPLPQGADISNLTGGSGSQGSQAETLGNQSPYGSDITLSSEGASASDPQQEYVVIQNNGQATVDISGWSLQSALTGARAYIPLGASFFLLGQINSQTGIELAPGGVAVVTTGTSPVGTSFRENECSGYLEQLQQYTPPLQTQCPSPSNAEAQASQYGQACSDYVSSLPFCTFPQNTPSDISAQCEAYVQTNFSYNGCVGQHQSDADFASPDWRIYLDGSRELWGNTKDTIRLLDSKGEVVAVTSY